MKDWEILFCTNVDGVSMQTFYHRTKGHKPTILVVQELNGNIFGAFASEEWHIDAKDYFGTGESFLYKIDEKGPAVFRWTGVNNSILNSNQDCITVGGG